MSRTAPPPPFRAALVDETGYLTNIWQQFFLTFFNSAIPGVPTGAIMPYGSATTPTGWLLCDGAEISQNKYNDLYNVLGQSFGGSDGTFKVPDLNGKFIRGSITSVGATGGNETFTIALTNLPNVSLQVIDPQHTHLFTASPHTHNITDPQHTHTFTGTVPSGAGTGGAAVGAATGTIAVTGTNALASTGITVNNATVIGTNAIAATGISVNLLGDSTAISLLPPYLSLAYIIKY